jgi:hypothetical protein
MVHAKLGNKPKSYLKITKVIRPGSIAQVAEDGPELYTLVEKKI